MLLESRKKIREKAHWLEQESFRFQAVTCLVDDESAIDSGNLEPEADSLSDSASVFDDWLEGFQITGDGKDAAVIAGGLQDDTETLAAHRSQAAAGDTILE